MTDPHATVLGRLTGLLMRAISYSTGDPAVATIAPATLAESQMWAEMVCERRIHSIAREA